MASAVSAKVSSVVAVLVMVGMCSTILLTAGRTDGEKDRVLSTIDEAGSRSIVIRADEGAGISPLVLDRIATIRGVSWAGAFGEAEDATNAVVSGGSVVAVRDMWTHTLSPLHLVPAEAIPGGGAFASADALTQLGMAAPAGSLAVDDQRQVNVIGQLRVPSYLTFLEPLIVRRLPVTGAGDVRVIVVVAANSGLVDAVNSAVQSVLAPSDSSKVSVSTSDQLVALHAVIDRQLNGFDAALTLGVFVGAAALVCVVSFAFVLMRRRDFGRRRALGASRGFIVSLLVLQTVILSVVGSIVGDVVAGIVLSAGSNPQPSASYYLAVDVLALVAGSVAAVLPAIYAARRDPIVELRVP